MNLLGREFGSDQSASGGGSGVCDVEDRDGLEDRTKGFGLAERTSIEDADPEALVAARRGVTAAQLEVDRLILVPHPFVGPHLRQAREHQTRRHGQGGRLRGHLGHDRERKDRKALELRVERRNLASTQRVVLCDRIVVGFENDEGLDLRARNQPANFTAPRPRLRTGRYAGAWRPQRRRRAFEFRRFVPDCIRLGHDRPQVRNPFSSADSSISDRTSASDRDMPP